VHSIIQGSIKNYRGKSLKRKMAGTPCKIRLEHLVRLEDTSGTTKPSDTSSYPKRLASPGFSELE
jgi:hypothetical protein